MARDLDNGQNVAIKIVPRFSKKRRLGRITQNVSPFEKTRREIAILKKVRHPNVVALLEVIDDPDYKKIYLCLEHVECGEVQWRKKGIPSICAFERRRIEREMRGEALTDEEEQYILELERRYNIKEMKRAHLAERNGCQGDPWSLELGDDADGTELAIGSVPSNSPAAHSSISNSQGPSRTPSMKSMNGFDLDPPSADTDATAQQPPSWNHSNFFAPTALDGTMYGAYDDFGFRERSPSVADSIISHMSSLDFNQTHPHDPFADDFSYVPCFTIHEARQVFRDVVLGLQYLHFQGIVHRDIKPANLLWTKEHNVKISDFGVSYFGRPMRESEPDDTVSESEAQDFDDELELSKTVGTPAFFAPELCYTDFDSGPPPRISDKIDVWSLGVTLYCMIFARIPFLAEDEFQMFRKIATEEVYVPRRRLRPVDPATSPKASSLYSRDNRGAPFRDDHELVYEDVDEDLRDLLFRMLIKNPEKRMNIRDVKHHPWVLGEMPDQIGWLDDTDPSVVDDGQKIKVSERDVSEAVAPLTLLERARSTLKKTLGKLTQSRSTDRSDDASRRRATSSAASSVGDSPAHTPITPHLREFRRKSLRGDVDYFAPVKEHTHSQSEHPLTYSVTASPDETPVDDAPTSKQSAAVGSYPPRHALEISTDLNGNDDVPERQTPTPSRLDFPRRHRYSQSISNATLALHHSLIESRTAPSTPAPDDSPDRYTGMLRKGRDMAASPEDSVRSQSVDRALVFTSQDKRAEPKVSVSTLIAPGAFEQPKRLQQVRSLDVCKATAESPLPSPNLFSPHAVSAYQYGQHKSEPMMDKFQTVIQIEERPMTAHRVKDLEGKTPPPRTYNTSNEESFARAQEIQRRRVRLEYEEELQRQQELEPPFEIDADKMPCPSSPDDDDFINSKAPSREETVSTTFSSNSNSGDAIATPWTSPSVVTSPVSYTTSASHKDLSEVMAFQSDPSLPALLSGASSVSADAEGEFLGVPGNPKALERNFLETTDSLTPPALGKEPIAGFPLEEAVLDEANLTAVRIGNGGKKSRPTPFHSCDENEDSDSEDEGILMMSRRSKKSNAARDSPKHVFAKRRNTNASVGSTDTAKKISLPEE